MFEAIENGFPHLIAAIRRACLMSHMEAVGVIYAHRYGDGFGGKAMNAMGGAKQCLRQTLRMRNYRRAVRLAA